MQRNPVVTVDDAGEQVGLTRSEQIAAQHDMQTIIAEVDRATPCRMCGAAVEPGGRDDGWWRFHDECTPEALTIVRALLGRRTKVTADDAELLWEAGMLPMPAVRRQTSHPMGVLVDELGRRLPGRTYSRTGKPAAAPWEWVNKADRAALARTVMLELPRLRSKAAAGPHPCEDGPCAYCGRPAALWWKRWEGKAWPDGTPAALCDQCSTWQHRATYTDDGWGTTSTRRAVLAAATGVIIDDPAVTVTAWAQRHSRDDVPTGRPWGHLDADELHALALDLRLRYPTSDPGDMADEVAAEQARREADAAVRYARKAEHEALTEPPGRRMWALT